MNFLDAAEAKRPIRVVQFKDKLIGQMYSGGLKSYRMRKNAVIIILAIFYRSKRKDV